MPANLENSAEATGLENVSFHSNPKKGNSKECSDYHTTMKLQYFGHLMRRADSLEKTLKLGKIEGRRRRG